MDYIFIIDSYKTLVENLVSINEALRDVVSAQQRTILKLQGLNTTEPKYNPSKPLVGGE